MTDVERPLREFAELPQLRVPGTDGNAEVRLRVHRINPNNYTQRITIARRVHPQTQFRYFDISLTKAQVLELIDELIDRIDVMTDDIPPIIGR